MPAATAIGIISSADSVGVSPRASCVKNISGSDMLAAMNPTVVIAMFDTEKLRSRKRSIGTSGSLLVRNCCQMNRPITATPAAIIPHTHAAQS
ncbi:hypothetical protein GCM10025738_18910 [Microbacterium fluvii]